jgi:hypothetical protein
MPEAIMVKLYVGKLPFSANEATLRDLFAQHGIGGRTLRMNAAEHRTRGRAESSSKWRGRWPATSVLRLNFRTVPGDSPTLMLAACVRFCADGTLRGPDNYVVARHLDGGWRVGGRIHRELECDGPVRLRLSSGVREPPRLLGPFRHVHTCGGVLYGDDTCLDIRMPGSGIQGGVPCHQLTMLFDGGSDAQD